MAKQIRGNNTGDPWSSQGKTDAGEKHWRSMEQPRQNRCGGKTLEIHGAAKAKQIREKNNVASNRANPLGNTH